MESLTNELSYADRYQYQSTAVAFFIAAQANIIRISINITKIQKLLYIAYGAHLAIKKFRLCEEHPQAWPYGPVFPKVRKNLLKEDLSAINMENAAIKDIKDDKYLDSLIKFVFQGFGNNTAGQLTEWSHKPGSPWDRTVSLPKFKWSNEIPDRFIIEYFNDIIGC